jgi:hypothetical protein
MSAPLNQSAQQTLENLQVSGAEIKSLVQFGQDNTMGYPSLEILYGSGEPPRTFITHGLVVLYL